MAARFQARILLDLPSRPDQNCERLLDVQLQHFIMGSGEVESLRFDHRSLISIKEFVAFHQACGRSRSLATPSKALRRQRRLHFSPWAETFLSWKSPLKMGIELGVRNEYRFEKQE
jgi:hypothetical protein